MNTKSNVAAPPTAFLCPATPPCRPAVAGGGRRVPRKFCRAIAAYLVAVAALSPAAPAGADILPLPGHGTEHGNGERAQQRTEVSISAGNIRRVRGSELVEATITITNGSSLPLNAGDVVCNLTFAPMMVSTPRGPEPLNGSIMTLSGDDVQPGATAQLNASFFVEGENEPTSPNVACRLLWWTWDTAPAASPRARRWP